MLVAVAAACITAIASSILMPIADVEVRSSMVFVRKIVQSLPLKSQGDVVAVRQPSFRPVKPHMPRRFCRSIVEHSIVPPESE